jgi:hypothetical protein
MGKLCLNSLSQTAYTSTSVADAVETSQYSSNNYQGDDSEYQSSGWSSSSTEWSSSSTEWSSTSTAYNSYSSPSYGSGKSNWGGSGYNDCVNSERSTSSPTFSSNLSFIFQNASPHTEPPPGHIKPVLLGTAVEARVRVLPLLLLSLPHRAYSVTSPSRSMLPSVIPSSSCGVPTTTPSPSRQNLLLATRLMMVSSSLARRTKASSVSGLAD